MRRSLRLPLSVFTALSLACGNPVEVHPGGDGSGSVGVPGPGGERGPEGPVGPPGPAGGYTRIKIVSPAPTPEEGGALMRATFASLTTASAENVWLVFVEPGVYDLGTEGLSLPPHVHVQGSGVALTTVRSHAEGPTLRIGEHTALRELTVEHSGGTADAVALATTSAGFQVRDVKASAWGGTSRTVAFASTPTRESGGVTRLEARARASRGEVFGFQCEGCQARFSAASFHAEGGARAVGLSVRQGSLELWDSFSTARASAESVGVEAGNTSVLIVRSDVTASEAPSAAAVRLVTSPANVRDSSLVASGGAEGFALDTRQGDKGSSAVNVQRSTLMGTIRGSTDYSVHLSGSLLRGGVEGQGVTCHGSYDDHYNTVPSDCGRVP